MTDPRGHPSIRRILLALDASASSTSALEAALDLAATWAAEVEALFIEDSDLIRWASLPAASHVGGTSRRTQPTNLHEIERQLEAVGDHLQRLIERSSSRTQVKTAFRRLRGNVAQALLNALDQADLLALGRGAPPTLGSTARAVVGGRPRFVFLAGRGQPARPLVAVYVEEAGRDHTAVAVALDLVRKKKHTLALISAEPTPIEILDLVERSEVPWHLHPARPATVPGAAAVASSLGAWVLVLSATAEPAQAIERAAKAFEGAILMVRPGVPSPLPPSDAQATR